MVHFNCVQTRGDAGDIKCGGDGGTVGLWMLYNICPARRFCGVGASVGLLLREVQNLTASIRHLLGRIVVATSIIGALPWL
jgi:hypothetical protein